jgi:ketosteroid isomerase-like protein
VNPPVAAPAAPASARPSPTQGARELSAAINRRDLEGALDCFAFGAMLATPDATVVRGESSIRSILAQVIDRGTAVEVESSEAGVAGGVATINELWTFTTPGPEGASHVQRCAPRLVLRPGVDAWKLVFASLWRPL